MAHKRKDTFSDSKVEYAKHLRPFGKRVQNKKERQKAKKIIEERY